MCGQAGHTRAKCVSAKAVYARTYYHVNFQLEAKPTLTAWKHVKGLTEEYCYEELIKGVASLMMAFKEVEDEAEPEEGHPDWDGCYKRPLYLYGNPTTLTPPPHHQDAINAKAGTRAILADGMYGSIDESYSLRRTTFLTQMERIWEAKMYSGLDAEMGHYERVDSDFKDGGIRYGNFTAMVKAEEPEKPEEHSHGDKNDDGDLWCEGCYEWVHKTDCPLSFGDEEFETECRACGGEDPDDYGSVPYIM